MQNACYFSTGNSARHFSPTFAHTQTALMEGVAHYSCCSNRILRARHAYWIVKRFATRCALSMLHPVRIASMDRSSIQVRHGVPTLISPLSNVGIGIPRIGGWIWKPRSRRSTGRAFRL